MTDSRLLIKAKWEEDTRIFRVDMLSLSWDEFLQRLRTLFPPPEGFDLTVYSSENVQFTNVNDLLTGVSDDRPVTRVFVKMTPQLVDLSFPADYVVVSADPHSNMSSPSGAEQPEEPIEEQNIVERQVQAEPQNQEPEVDLAAISEHQIHNELSLQEAEALQIEEEEEEEEEKEEEEEEEEETDQANFAGLFGEFGGYQPFDPLAAPVPLSRFVKTEEQLEKLVMIAEKLDSKSENEAEVQRQQEQQIEKLVGVVEQLVQSQNRMVEALSPAKAAPTKLPPASLPLPRVHHTNVRCDNCHTHIVGIRYKCGHCWDFDLCSNCENLLDHNEAVHDPSHIFIKIRRPIPSGTQLPHRPLLRRLPTLPPLSSIAVAGPRAPVVSFDLPTVAPSAPVPLPVPIPKSAVPLPVPPIKRGTLSAYFVGDINYPDGSVLSPGQKFVKSWLVQNSGSIPWPAGCSIVRCEHDTLTNVSSITITSPPHPSEHASLDVPMTAPLAPGTYKSTWRLAANGREFGPLFWAEIVVPASAVAALASSPLVEAKVEPAPPKFQTLFQVNDRLEAIDRKNPALLCVAHIKEISSSGQLLISFDGWNEYYDYWSTAPHAELAPVGTASSLGLVLQAPKQYMKPFTWSTYLQEIGARQAPVEAFPVTGMRDSFLSVTPVHAHASLASLFTPAAPVTNTAEAVVIESPAAVVTPVSSASTSTSTSASFRVGDRLEAIDLKYDTLVCVAHVKNINADGDVLISFDGWNETYDYWSTAASGHKHIAPVGTCQQLGLVLQPPKHATQPFDWNENLTFIGGRAAPTEAFPTKGMREGYNRVSRVIVNHNSAEASSSHLPTPAPVSAPVSTPVAAAAAAEPTSQQQQQQGSESVVIAVEQPVPIIDVQPLNLFQDNLEAFVPVSDDDGFQEPLSALLDMGFFNRQENLRLLRLYNGAVDAVVHHIVEAQDLNWHSRR